MLTLLEAICCIYKRGFQSAPTLLGVRLELDLIYLSLRVIFDWLHAVLVSFLYKISHFNSGGWCGVDPQCPQKNLPD